MTLQNYSNFFAIMQDKINIYIQYASLHVYASVISIQNEQSWMIQCFRG